MRAIQTDVARNDPRAACGKLGAFVNEVNTQTGKKIGSGQATFLVAQAQNIAGTLGC